MDMALHRHQPAHGRWSHEGEAPEWIMGRAAEGRRDGKSTAEGRTSRSGGKAGPLGRTTREEHGAQGWLEQPASASEKGRQAERRDQLIVARCDWPASAGSERQQGSVTSFSLLHFSFFLLFLFVLPIHAHTHNLEIMGAPTG
jgi:hypothetical protein